MAESGCVRDLAVQNLEVAGTAQLTPFTGRILTVVDAAAAVTTLTNAHHGMIIKHGFDFSVTETAIINLPATVVDGFRCKIVLTAAPTAAGVLTVRTNVGTNRLLCGGYVNYSATAATSAGGEDFPATDDSDVSVAFTGLATNCIFGIGTVIDVEGVASAPSPGYILSINSVGQGTGVGGGIAFA
jgi:hypothetical protein